VNNYKDAPMRLDLVKILGVDKPASGVTVNGKAFTKYLYNIPDQVNPLQIRTDHPHPLELDSCHLCFGFGHGR
jgi:hypothetical protein